MGCYDGVKVCEPEGFFLSNKLWNIFDKESVRLYRDYGFCVLQNLSGPETERKRKAIVKAFKDCGLRIIIQANLWIVRFCYVQLNFDTSTYQPYRKPDNNPVYLKKISNHPTTILKQLPKSIEKCMLDISLNENVFTQSTPIYQDTLQKSGFAEQFNYIASDNNRNNPEEKKWCKRKIIWFNLPYIMNVRTNIGKTFLKLMRKYFPNGNPLHKIFNKNMLKVSYSCMSNMASIMLSHNHTILNPDVSLEYGCICRSRNDCLLQNNCLTPRCLTTMLTLKMT